MPAWAEDDPREYEWDLIGQVPCSISLLPVARREAAFHDFDAYEKLLDAAIAIDWRTYLIALLGGEGGLRVGEIGPLEWADIDLERRQINVRHSDWRGQLTTPKNGRGRLVGMTERVAATALRKHRHLRGTISTVAETSFRCTMASSVSRAPL